MKALGDPMHGGRAADDARADPRGRRARDLDPHGRGYVAVDLLGRFPGFVDPRGTAVVFPDEADARAATLALISLRDGEPKRASDRNFPH